jgi:uroporphyrinogen-III decarboxylase
MSLGPQVDTGLPYAWYVDGWFKTPEILYSFWDEHGKPSELLNDKVNYSPQIWDEYVESLSPYLYPMANLFMPMHENIFEGMTVGRAQYYMRKKPSFIHDVMKEYTKAILEMIKRLAEAGVDVAFYYDDLGMKGRTIFSIRDLQEFIIPYYKQMYQGCKKHGMFIVQHSCGYIDEILPYMVEAGLSCIQALEPAAGVNLGHLKDTLGDKVSFMGGLDSSRVLSFGTAKEIENEVKRGIMAAGQGGGYFVGPSHNILNVPWENCISLRDAMLKHRNYPLK